MAVAEHLTPMDAGSVKALLQLADRIDAGEALYALFPAYLKFCESLGLTPAGRKRLDEKKESGGGKLAQLRAVDGGQSKRRGPRTAG